MAVLETSTDDVALATEVRPADPPADPGATIRVAAIALWGVVGSLLGYGVLQTVLKASALFA
ncbi:hypothetical protein [Actinotalea sp. Marseille-Q4924]|uniref:MFS transporter small subunit n=1 Tax=Actinotalea sp. Marseille-Q4924 TaxID=2866571 RepID=UPI001CE4A66C|nr:hypothetical protein [Actinotalea sp. Marseille-Q4924]